MVELGPRIRVTRQDELAPGASTPGIERFKAFATEKAVVLQAQCEGGVTSGWHHHGDRDVFGYLIAGRARFDFGPGGTSSVEMQAGDFMHVPAGLIHRDVNPDPEQGQRWVLVMVGSGPVAVDVDGPEPRP